VVKIAVAAIGPAETVQVATVQVATGVRGRVEIEESAAKADVRISAEAVGVLSTAQSISSSKSLSPTASISIIRRTSL